MTKTRVTNKKNNFKPALQFIADIALLKPFDEICIYYNIQRPQKIRDLMIQFIEQMNEDSIATSNYFDDTLNSKIHLMCEVDFVKEFDQACSMIGLERSQVIRYLMFNLITKKEVRKELEKRTNTEDIPGITFDNKCKSWIVKFSIKRKIHYIGSFKDEEKARQARDMFIERNLQLMQKKALHERRYTKKEKSDKNFDLSNNKSIGNTFKEKKSSKTNQIVTIDDLKNLEKKYCNKKPSIKKYLSYKVERRPLANKIKQINNFECQICKELGNNPHAFIKPNGQPYIEAHHVTPVSTNKKGVLGVCNLITVCPNHHRQLHYGIVDILENDEEKFVFKIDNNVVTVPKVYIR